VNIQGALQLHHAASSTLPQPVIEAREAEVESKVFAPVDASPKSGSSQNDQFQQSQDSGKGSDDVEHQKSQEQQAAQNQLEQQQLKQDQAEIEKLQMRDNDVRLHEAAHAAAGGAFAGSPSFEYETGPDGRRYAVGGEVQISTSKVPGDPEQTLRKAQQIKAAALAPAEPSAQDRRVAAQAAQMSLQAQAEILEMQQIQLKEAQADSGGETRIVGTDGGGDSETSAEVANSGEFPTVHTGDTEKSSSESTVVMGAADGEEEPAVTNEKGDLVSHLVGLGAIDENQPVGGLLNLMA